MQTLLFVCRPLWALGVTRVEYTSKMFWRVSTYTQQTPADAILDKGHVILEDLLEVEDLAMVQPHSSQACMRPRTPCRPHVSCHAPCTGKAQ